MAKKKIKQWTKAAKKAVKPTGIAWTAKVVLQCSADHMSAMLCGRVATTAANAEKLAEHFELSAEDFGQQAGKAVRGAK